jgi:DNA adenine methylase
MLKPFLKWAGGKTRVIQQYHQYFPKDITNYVEPFLGSGSVFFYLQREGYLNDCRFKYLSDSNKDLVITYWIIRNNVSKLIEKLSLMEIEHKKSQKSYYYYVRNEEPTNHVDIAARFIYLNKTCFNGLYRVNKLGKFNVPFGHYINPRIFDVDNLYLVHDVLQSVIVQYTEYQFVPHISKGFYYFDPPYAPWHLPSRCDCEAMARPWSTTSNFTGCTPVEFTYSHHTMLAVYYQQLTELGCRCMLSNSDTPFIRNLYKDYHIISIKGTRTIQANAVLRGMIPEVLILNYTC